MNIPILRILAATAAIFISAYSQAGVVHILDADGKLKGAQNISFLGGTYDVEFKQGACVDVFNGCDNAALKFNQDNFLEMFLVLRSQVFIDQYRTSQILVTGCTSRCAITIPRWIPERDGGEWWIGTYISQIPAPYDTLYGEYTESLRYYNGNDIFAVFTGSPLPEPTPILLFIIGAFGLVVRKHFTKN